jgi:tetratricopeptide (TPR) repeat protein
LKKVTDSSPEQALRLEAKRNLAYVYFQMGDFEKALPQLEDILKKVPLKALDERTFYILILVYHGRGNTDEANKYKQLMKKYIPKSGLLKLLP